MTNYCISVDWLQLYCNVSHLILSKNYDIILAPFQTRQFRKLYYINHKQEAIAELVAEPVSQIIPSYAGILKINNRVLYRTDLYDVVNVLLSDLNIEFINITRIDLAIDFNTFKHKLHPERMIDRFVKDIYLKVGRGKFSIYGEQKQSTTFQTLRFGTRGQPINTYLYNKTEELIQKQDKPYIRKKWEAYKLDISRDIWRLEISITSQGCHYVNLNTGEQERINLDILQDIELLHHTYFSYVYKYFRFKINDDTKNKTRMKDVPLFDDYEPIFKPFYLPEHTGSNRADKIFIKKLYQLDEELRGKNDDLNSAQKQILQTVVNRLDLWEWYNKNEFRWKLDVKRQY